ncbi:hypothetical protein Xen7305DRAFT_00043550 [Xenococcus sp. PCC 7305]|uniref:hypothetical protein n=1 Tax=Xenococcus sp. PCC 7305 TaxID=102125 RepID=UPI0002ABF256|nr:hypothetical protein [Xenococcus sp. PCC 7305]ELS04619.1 hypothetical protein Xen7305DRAFT_00043550 [Xenococcus sp. PCC 7305]
MNQKLVKSLIQIIQSLSEQERQMLEEQLSLDANQVSTKDIMNLAQKSHSFDFLDDEPNLYTLEDGEPI